MARRNLGECDTRVAQLQSKVEAHYTPLRLFRAELDQLGDAIDDPLGMEAVRRADRRKALVEAEGHILDGFSRDTGCLHAIAHLAGTPGLNAIEAEIEALLAEREVLLKELADNAAGPRPYRLKQGSKLKVWFPDPDQGRRRVQPSESVKLSAQQLRAFGEEYFEPVSEDTYNAQETERAELRAAWLKQQASQDPWERVGLPPSTV
jgi:hypothetical protein